MTIEEAKIFFPLGEDECVEELYEERIFEYKQFFLTKMPIRKVFESKLSKMQKMQVAYEVINASNDEKAEVGSIEGVSFSDKVAEAFSLFEMKKTQIKQQLMMASTTNEVIFAVTQFLEVVDAYRQKWEMEVEADVDVEQLAKDSDPMEVLAAIRVFESNGGVFFKDILEMKDNTFLLKEMKRLSLLSKKYGNGRGI